MEGHVRARGENQPVVEYRAGEHDIDGIVDQRKPGGVGRPGRHAAGPIRADLERSAGRVAPVDGFGAPRMRGRDQVRCEKSCGADGSAQHEWYAAHRSSPAPAECDPCVTGEDTMDLWAVPTKSPRDADVGDR